MGTKPRGPDQTAIGISLPRTLLADIDRRAKALGLNRSQYLAALARRDVETRGDLTLTEADQRTASSPTPSDTEDKVVAIVKKHVAKGDAAHPKVQK